MFNRVITTLDVLYKPGIYCRIEHAYTPSITITFIRAYTFFDIIVFVVVLKYYMYCSIQSLCIYCESMHHTRAICIIYIGYSRSCIQYF